MKPLHASAKSLLYLGYIIINQLLYKYKLLMLINPDSLQPKSPKVNSLQLVILSVRI